MTSRNRFIVGICLFALLSPDSAAHTRKGDALLQQARRIEANDQTADLDQALELARQALATDPTDIAYQLAVNRLRAFAAQYHVYEGQVSRDKGDLKRALQEFEKAASLDPASIVAPQEAGRTRELIAEVAKKPDANLEDLLLRPLPRKNKRDEEMYSRTLPVPQIDVALTRPLPLIQVNGQGSIEAYQALCKEAGVRVFFDGEFQSRGLGANQSLDFRGLGISQALDFLALISKSFWKPLSADTIFVSGDDPQRRGAYEDQVTKAFYLTNAPSAQEVNDVASTVQKVTDIRKLFVHSEQSVIVARADPDRIALAEKIVADLDKPKAEIIIDVIILSVAKNWLRNLGVNLALNGTSAQFSPRPLLTGTPAGSTAATITPSPDSRVSIPLNALAHLTSGDFNVTLPSATLNALLQVTGTKLLDKAELRTIEGQKSTLNIGQKYPYATGSFLPGSSGTGSALVNTQFQFLDIGLNIAVTAKVHEPDEVSLHIESDTSSVESTLNVGNLSQPIVSQRKRVADVRVKEGEINFWDIVTQRTETRDKTGIPFLSQIPILNRAFTSEKIQLEEQQVLTLLIPHIIRAPDIRKVNLMGISSGSDQVVRMRYQGADAPKGTPDAPGPVIQLPPGQAPQPGVAPGMGQPGMGQPGMGQQGMGQPGMGQPGMGQPGMQPGMQPGQAPGGMPRAGNARIFFSPAKIPGRLNSAFTAELTIADASDLGESLAVVQFDPRALKLNGVSPGPVLANSGGISGPNGQKIEDGVVMLKFGKPGASNGVIATFTFEPLSPGSAAVLLPGGRLLGGNGQEINAKYDPLEVLTQ